MLTIENLELLADTLSAKEADWDITIGGNLKYPFRHLEKVCRSLFLNEYGITNDRKSAIFATCHIGWSDTDRIGLNQEHTYLVTIRKSELVNAGSGIACYAVTGYADGEASLPDEPTFFGFIHITIRH